MIRLLSIVVFVCLSFAVVKAQDSLQIHLQGIQERTDQAAAIRNNLYKSPALRPFQYKQSMTPVDISYIFENKERYNYQLGSGEKGVKIATDSYIKDAFPNMTLWGNAKYENVKVQNLKFNETSDFELVFPYVIADSVGGNLNMETYQFSGGIAKEDGNWIFAGEAGYKANLSHRKIDPRPNNNSSDIYAKLGLGYSINSNSVLSVNFGARSYKQRNTLAFVAVLGRPNLYHFNGLASYNALLSGSSESSGANLYAVNGFNAKIFLAPKNQNGVFAEAAIEQNAGERTLPLSSASANNWTDQIISGKLGYFNEIADLRYGALATIDLQTRKGSEGLFNNDGANTGGYTKISEISSYRYYNFNYNLEAYFGKKGWSIKPYANYSQFKEQYINPFREQVADIVKVGVQGQYLFELNEGLFGISLNLQKQKVIDKKSTFNISQGIALADLLNHNYAYLTSEPFQIAAEARYDFVLSKQIKPFVKAQAQTSTEIKQKYYSLSLGIMF